MNLNSLKNKKICILGLGIENYTLVKFLLAKKINCETTICDNRSKKELGERYKELETHNNASVRWKLGKNYDKGLKKYDIIFTTGSTGIGTRDIAPEIILPFLEKQISGVMDMIRIKYGMENPNALLSRSIAGIKGKTILFALPGNPKAVTEYLNEIFKILHHSILMLHDINNH